MSDFERVAIVGTGQMAPSDAEQTASAVDGLVAQLPVVDRERALMLRAGGLALLERAARPSLGGVPRPTPAGEETLRPPSAKLTEILSGLFAANGDELLLEALEHMANARMRLPEELLPIALATRDGSLRAQLRPVLGERGLWLARSRTEWAWALSTTSAMEALPSDLDARWEDASASERKLLLRAARAVDPAAARRLAESSWKQEKAEQRLQWLEVFEKNLSKDDEAFLTSARSDRSAQVRVAAARLLWRIPESGVATRVRQRVEALISVVAPSGGVFGKLRSLVGGEAQPTLSVELPPEAFDATWEKEGIVETAPQGVGRRQWWLTQMLSSVHPDHWCTRLGISADKIVAAASAHELGDVLLDGLTTAALRHLADAWYAPLYDAAAMASKPRLTHDPIAALASRLTSVDAAPRMLSILQGGRLDLLPSFPRPWPRKVSEVFVRALSTYRAGWGVILRVAAMAIPVEQLPATVPIPEVPENDYAAQAYLRALDEFQSMASARRAIAQEIAP